MVGRISAEAAQILPLTRCYGCWFWTRRRRGGRGERREGRRERERELCEFMEKDEAWLDWLELREGRERERPRVLSEGRSAGGKTKSLHGSGGGLGAEQTAKSLGNQETDDHLLDVHFRKNIESTNSTAARPQLQIYNQERGHKIHCCSG